MANAEVSTTMDDTNTHWQSIFVGVVITVVVAFLIIYIVKKSAPWILGYVVAFIIIALIKRTGIHLRMPRNREAISDTGEPLQIIRITHKVRDGKNINGVELEIDNLEKIMFHPDVKRNPVVIISIFGSFRKGKSFLLGFFLKYLRTRSQSDWLRKDDKIKGFEWRGGTERVTSGINIWSQPFILKNKYRKKVVVLLMDTQGVFDNVSTYEDCASIFAITNLISSIQIYNLMHQLQEDDLHMLEDFTAFEKLVAQKKNESDMNKAKLVFLIRDWEYHYQYPYGKDGGNAYIQKQLEMKLNQHKELQEIRITLCKWFPNIFGFLLPHPGRAIVTKEIYDGTVKDLDDDFVQNVKMFVSYILSRDMLIPKQIHNETVTGKDLVKYIKAFVKLLEKGEFPTPQTAFKATAEVARGEAIKRAFRLYKDNMCKVCILVSGEPISMELFHTYHEQNEDAARSSLRKTSELIILEHERECVENLNILIKEEYTTLRKLLDEQIKCFNANSKQIMIKAAFTGLGFGIGTAAFEQLPVGGLISKIWK